MHISHRCTLGFLHTISFTLLVCALRAVSIAIWKESLTKLPVCDAFWRVIVCLLAGARWKHWKFFSCANLIIVHHTTFVAIQAFLVDWAGKEMPSLNHWETQFTFLLNPMTIIDPYFTIILIRFSNHWLLDWQNIGKSYCRVLCEKKSTWNLDERTKTP